MAPHLLRRTRRDISCAGLGAATLAPDKAPHLVRRAWRRKNVREMLAISAVHPLPRVCDLALVLSVAMPAVDPLSPNPPRRQIGR